MRQHENLDEITAADGDNQHHDNCLDEAHAQPLQAEKEQHIEGGDDDRPRQGNMKEKVERHGAAENLGQIASGDGDLASQPQRVARPVGIIITTGLGQVFARDNAKTRGHDLHDDGHEARQGHYPQ